MRGFDFSSWQTILTSIAGLLLVTLIGMGIRLVMIVTLQQRRERQNRQINGKALIAAASSARRTAPRWAWSGGMPLSCDF